MGELRVLNGTGDSRFTWDPKDKDQVAGAKAQFDALKKKNYIAYTVGKDGKRNDVISKFDPKLGAIIMVPPIQGG